MIAQNGLPPGIDRWPVGLMTIGRGLAINAARCPNKLAISHPLGSLTYGELNERTNRLAHYLLNRGIGRGDHVALIFGNSIEHIVALYAVAKIGAISVVLDPKWVSREVNQALTIFDCRFLIFESVRTAAIEDATNEIEIQCLAFDLSSMPETFKGLPRDEPPSQVSDDDVFMIMLTSGTTGIPKGCVKTHRSYLYNCVLACSGNPIDHDSRELMVVPIYYNSGRSSLITHLFIGGSVYLREKFDPTDVLETIQQERITTLALAPTQCNELLSFPRLADYDKSSLRFLRKAGLPFQTRVVKRIIEELTPNLYQGFGGTEFSTATILRPHEQLQKLGSAGRPVMGTEVQIVGEDRVPLPPGVRGEVRVRGPGVCHGYYNNEAANLTTFIDGWYYSGDLGYLDEDGYLFIVGRIKDLVKTGGINVAPREVEDVILSFPEVADVAVIGVSSDKWGEALKALIVLKSGERLSPEIIAERCALQLSRYKIPRLIEFVDSIPRSPLGKITAEFKASHHS